MRNVLVIGMNGMIGAGLFSYFQSIGVSVWGTSHRHEIKKQRNVFYLNLLDEASSWTFPEVNFDVVYLCAGVTQMAMCENDPLLSNKVNVTGIAKLVHYLSRQGAFIIYLSTNQVFSGQKPFVLAQSPYSPMNEYGFQKAQAEDIIKSDCIHWAIVRLTKVVEPNMALIKNWIDHLLQSRSIEAYHDMMLAPVSLEHVIKVLVRVGEKKQVGCYQVSGAQDISYHDVASYLAYCLKRQKFLVRSVSAMDKGVKKIFLPRFTTLDCSSTIDLCGEKPPHFADVLHDCFELEALPA